MAAQPLETKNGENDENDEEVDGDDDESDGGTTPNTNGVFAADSNAKESNAVLELKLKLRLIEAEKAVKREEWEMQKERSIGSCAEDIPTSWPTRMT